MKVDKVLRIMWFSITLVFVSSDVVLAKVATSTLSRARTPFQKSTRAVSDENVILVPEDVANLQDAINQVVDGGVIEISPGNYSSPKGGFVINNPRKAFTIRASKKGQVVLDGGGTRDILRFINQDLSLGGVVRFDGLEFANGFSSTDGIAGGVTLHRAKAVFVDCIFRNNQGYQGSTGGGGVVVALGSIISFENCTWESNSARNFGGGIAIEDQSSVQITNSEFKNNRTNVVNHALTASGGGIHVGNSDLSVSNTTFVNNRAGYVGGAIFVIGTWSEPISVPRSTVIITNCTFSDNKSSRDPSVVANFPTEGGAFHAEDQTLARIRSSKFVTNQAMIGGAVNLYRSIVEVDNSVFFGNQATGAGPANGFGGAISAVSNDTGMDGNVNRRPANLIVNNSLIQGNYGGINIVGQAGGGIYVAGDGNRAYGVNGASKIGAPQDNRASVSIDKTIFLDTDVQEMPGAAGTGIGGAIMVDLADLTVSDSLIMLADALGETNSAGGGLAIINQSKALISGTTVARNTAGKFGAGVFVQGSEISLSKCKLFADEISPGVNESMDSSYGAAIFISPDFGRNIPVVGYVSDCSISNNIGLSIFEQDRISGPANEVIYNNNQVYSTSFNDVIFSNSIGGYCCKNVSELNNLVISRDNGVNTKKAEIANSFAQNELSLGTLLAMPSYITAYNPVSLPIQLAYAWNGEKASLNGKPLSDGAGLYSVSDGGEYNLSVDDQVFSIEILKLDKQIFVPFLK